jgi:hypothetical protein
VVERDISRKVDWTSRANAHQYTITKLYTRRGIRAGTPLFLTAEAPVLHAGFLVDGGCGEGFSLSSSLPIIIPSVFHIRLSSETCTVAPFEAALPRDSGLPHS